MYREVLNGKIGEGVDRRKKDDLREGLCIEKCLKLKFRKYPSIHSNYIIKYPTAPLYNIIYNALPWPV